jgi:nucleoid-associated protein YgaU
LPAVLILIGGAAAAFGFRQEADRPSVTPNASPDMLVRRVQPAGEPQADSTTQLLGYVEPAVGVGRDAQPERRTASRVDQVGGWSELAPRSSVTLSAPVPTNLPPPPMSAYPPARTAAVGPPPMATMRPYEAGVYERPATASVLSSTPANVARSHTVRDGDTLGDLAERYYGDARRYREIFDANRAALEHPEVLPIGTTLTIPAYDPRTVAPPKNDPPAARLVPQPVFGGP